MLEQVLAYLNNWFLVDNGIHFDAYVIQGGNITLPFLQNEQYFRIIGSIFNDGLWQYPTTDLKDETFDGAVWALAIPKAVIQLSEEIAEWQQKNGEITVSPYTSESFGGYSYTKAANENTGAALTWQGVFGNRLNVYKKINELGFAVPARRYAPYATPYYNPWR